MVKDLETIQYDGIWWLPDTKENKINGNLSISCKGESFLSLFSPIEENNHNGDEYEIIFGFSNNGRLISLQYCLVNESPVVYPGLRTQKISAENVYITHTFIGAEYRYYEPSAKINKMLVKFTYLNDWLDQPLFKHDRRKSDENRFIDNITHTPPVDYETDFSIGDINGRLKICYEFGEIGYRYDNPTRIFSEHFFESGLKIENKSGFEH